MSASERVRVSASVCECERVRAWERVSVSECECVRARVSASKRVRMRVNSIFEFVSE